MPRRTLKVEPLNLELVKKQLLHWASGQEHGVFLDGNDGATDTWTCLVAASAHWVMESQAGKAFEKLREAYDTFRGDWLFGFLCYDLKNETERLYSGHPDGVGFPDMAFFQPKTVAGIRGGILEIHCLHDDPAEVWKMIQQVDFSGNKNQQTVVLQPRMTKAGYLERVETIREHIAAGDLYEMNLCQEFFAEGANIHPVDVFERLNGLSRAPFATFMRWADRYLLCGSPERFLRKQGGRLISQPIKGTRRRNLTDASADEALRRSLVESEKDRAENVMIVDLVRNDLARNCLPGSVVVDELFGIYSFPTVHQMISTVRGDLKPGAHPIDALRDTFPMGSMTGAPKVMAMELIEKYERTRRGLYSGAVGYIDPEGNFDFNVVIRSILYNAASGYVSAQVGGAIVYDSVPEEEYQECLLKAEAMKKSLQ
ncbi:MAG: anthranilate synthase component I family protein [Saprospiraceae bacterium]|nr:anthranilate synthase component I family protein [Saprospiraceae bacterium]